MLDLDAATAADPKLALAVKGVSLGTKYAYYYTYSGLSKQAKRDFNLDEWLSKELSARASVSLSLCGGMPYMQTVLERAEEDVRAWIDRTKLRLAPPSYEE